MTPKTHWPDGTPKSTENAFDVKFVSPRPPVNTKAHFTGKTVRGKKIDIGKKP